MNCAYSSQASLDSADAVAPAVATGRVQSKPWAMLPVLLLLLACLNIFTPSAALAAGSEHIGSGIISFILHLDKHISAMITNHGRTTYVILWAIVFCETGLVLTPFLPGDSLLFAAGAFAGMGRLDLGLLLLVFFTAAVIGDALNYTVGYQLGFWALEKKLLKREYITKTENFYKKYGGKTVVLARFVPIIRTFAPFVAGIARMQYTTFTFYNILGAAIWSVLFTGAGYFFGNLPFVQHNFTLVVLAIVAVSVIPVVIEVIQARKEPPSETSSTRSA